MRMLNRNPKRLSAEVFSSAQKQPKQNASSQNREENGSTTLRNTREKPLLAGYEIPELNEDKLYALVQCFYDFFQNFPTLLTETNVHLYSSWLLCNLYNIWSIIMEK